MQPTPTLAANAGRYRLQLLPRQPYEAAYTPAYPVIGFAFEAQAGAHAFAGERKMPFRTRPNSLAFVPAGCDVYSQSREGGEYLVVTPLPGAGEAPREERRFNDVIDTPAIEAAQGLRRLLLSNTAAEPLSVERLALILEERVAGALGHGARGHGAATWMTPRRLRIVEELIEARLDAPLSLQELADAVGLSSGFFARAFRAAIGKPPHAYIIDRRIARARALIAAGDLGLSAIALACGFASHAHMTAQFRARLGVTPAALRKAR